MPFAQVCSWVMLAYAAAVECSSHGSWIALHKREQCLATNPWARDQRGHRWEKKVASPTATSEAPLQCPTHHQPRPQPPAPAPLVVASALQVRWDNQIWQISAFSYPRPQHTPRARTPAPWKMRFSFPPLAASEEQASLFLQWSIFKTMAEMPRFEGLRVLKVDKTSW